MNSNSPIHGRRLTRSTLLALAVLAAASASCSSSSTSGTTQPPADAGGPQPSNVKGPQDAAPPRDGGQIVMGLEGEPEGLDPTRFAFAASGHYIASAVFEPLATIDAGGQAVPYLATAIQPNADFTTWTITLPEGVKFHDNTTLDSAVVKANLDAHRSSMITRLAMLTVADVQAPDATHVTVALTKPWVRFPNLLTSQIGYVLAPAMLADPELSKKPIGTGPFVFDSHVDFQSWTFKKNPNYHHAGLPHVGSMLFKIIVDEGERQRALEAGDVDVIHSAKPDQVLALKASGAYKIVNYSGGEEDFLTVNTLKPPFDSLTARRAVAYATDSAGWLRDRTKNVEQASNSPYAPGQLGYEKDNGYPAFDMNKAKELAAQYQTETGQQLSFSLATTEGLDNQADAQYFIKAYEQAGMKVTALTYKQIQLVAQTATGNFEMALFRNFGFHDPDTDATFFRSASALDLGGLSLNFPHYRDPAVDEALDKALAAPTDAERDQAYRSLQRIFAEKLPYLWLGRPEWVLAANPRVNGIYPAANGTIQTLGAKTWLSEMWVSQ